MGDRTSVRTAAAFALLIAERNYRRAQERLRFDPSDEARGVYAQCRDELAATEAFATILLMRPPPRLAGEGAGGCLDDASRKSRDSG